MKERSQSRPAVGAGRRTVGTLPGNGGPGGVPSTCSPGPDEWHSWRVGPPCGWWSGSRDRTHNGYFLKFEIC